MAKKYSNFLKSACLIAFFVGISLNLSQAADNALDREDELFSVAQKAFEDGYYDVALRYLEQFFKDFPETNKRPQVNLLIGQCYFFSNQYLKAFDAFQALLNSSDSKDIRDAVIFWMGETYLKGKDYKQAQSFYQQLINEFPKSAYLYQAYYSLGWTYYEDGQFRQSLGTFQKLTENFKQSDLAEDAEFKIGECLFNLNEYEKLKNHFISYINNYPHSQKLYLANFYIAEANYFLEDFNAALDNYSKVISLSQDDKIKIQSKINSAWALLKLKKYDAALKNFEEAEAVSKKKGFPLDDILIGKGNLFAELEQYDKAFSFYEELINSCPNSALLDDAYLGKANALYGLSRHKESVAAYRFMLKRIPESKNLDLKEKVYFGLAWANLKLGNLDEAIENFKFVADNSEDKLMRLSASCQIADAYQDMGALSKAQDIYDRILKDYPDSPYADYVQYQDGIVLLKMGKLDAATLIFQSLKSNFPKSKFITDAKYYLGSAYFKKGDFAACIEQFDLLIKTLPRESELRPEAMFNLGLSFVHLEKYKEAIEILERITKEYPADADLIQRSEFEIANTMFNQGKVKDALKKFKIIIYKYPRTKISLQATSWLGDYYLKDKKFDLALKYFNQIIDEFGESNMVDEAHYKLGKALLDMGNFSEAEKELDKVGYNVQVQLAVETKFAKAFILSKKDLNAAVAAYEQLLKEYPGFAKSTFIKLASAYKSLNDFDKAIASLAKGLIKSGDDLLEKTDGQIQFEIADLQEAKGDLNKAIEGYLKIPYLYPQENTWVVKSYLRVARIFEDKNDWDEARKIYEKVASQNIEEAKFAQERLDWINKNLKNK